MSDQPSVPSSPPPPPTTPGQPPQPIGPAGGLGGAGLIAQFTGNAGWAILVGIITVVVPLVFNRIYFFLPIIGLIIAIYAIVRRQVIGGVVALILNVIGGILTIIGLTGG